ASTVSRLVAPDEGVVRFAVRLKPAEEQTVTVLLPNGRPAAGVDIGLLAPNAGLVLTPSGFSRLRTRGLDCLRQTDEAGKFSLPSDDSVQGVIAAGTPGYVMVTRAALEADPVIRLAPWGGVSGVCTQQDRPVAGVLLGLESAVNPQTLSLDFERFQVRTDQAGRFDFQRVPPGLVRLAQREEDSSGGITSRPRRMLVVEAGTMEEIVLTEGVSLSVHPRWSTEPAAENPGQVMGFLRSPKPQIAPPLLEDPTALAAWARQPENRALLDAVGSYRLRQQPDGSWATDGVTPGSYLLRFEIRAQKDLRLVSKFEQPVTIPPDPPTGHIDLGEVVLQPADQQSVPSL
ncbi:MAG: hypothetical protein KDM81_18235, partial [Verrucomicrobiae bacterium]|nr:hypothetical protein [Verrucomicrobiae bacterium]